MKKLNREQALKLIADFESDSDLFDECFDIVTDIECKDCPAFGECKASIDECEEYLMKYLED